MLEKTPSPLTNHSNTTTTTSINSEGTVSSRVRVIISKTCHSAEAFAKDTVVVGDSNGEGCEAVAGVVLRK
jgi:hypothetical protein